MTRDRGRTHAGLAPGRTCSDLMTQIDRMVDLLVHGMAERGGTGA